MERSSFRDNGRNPNATQSDLVYWAWDFQGGLRLGNPEYPPENLMVVRDPSFSGNAGFALLSYQTMDAMQNWWGLPNGPRVSVWEWPMPEPAEVGTGDQLVTHHVQFAPFLRDDPNPSR